MLRATRRQDVTDQWVSVSGADPLNLVGILTPGAKLPALAGNRLLYRDGISTAVLAAGDIQFLETLDDAREWDSAESAAERTGTLSRRFCPMPMSRLVAEKLQSTPSCPAGPANSAPSMAKHYKKTASFA